MPRSANTNKGIISKCDWAPTEISEPTTTSKVKKTDTTSSSRTLSRSLHVLKELRTVTEGSVEELARRLHDGVVYKAGFESVGTELMNELRRIDGVSGVTSLEDDVVAIPMTKDYDLRPSLARLALQHGSLLLSCGREEASPEELFLYLVKVARQSKVTGQVDYRTALSKATSSTSFPSGSWKFIERQ